MNLAKPGDRVRIFRSLWSSSSSGRGTRPPTSGDRAFGIGDPFSVCRSPGFSSANESTTANLSWWKHSARSHKTKTSMRSSLGRSVDLSTHLKTSRKASCSNSSQGPTRTWRKVAAELEGRGSEAILMLMVGDPGVSKSQILQVSLFGSRRWPGRTGEVRRKRPYREISLSAS